MALTSRTDPVDPREPATEISRLFGLAQDSKPNQQQLDFQKEVRLAIAFLAQDINALVEDSREKSLALTHLEEALLWTGKAIFR
jgi:hypothetical protein